MRRVGDLVSLVGLAGLAGLALTCFLVAPASAELPCTIFDTGPECTQTADQAELQGQVNALRGQLAQQQAAAGYARQEAARHQSFQRTERWMQGMQPRTFMDNSGRIQTFQPLNPPPY